MKRQGFKSLEQQRTRWGWVFLAPWIVGIAVFFLWPMIQTGIYSFSMLTASDGFETTFVGLENYLRFFNDAKFLQDLATSVVETAPSTLLIITFSTIIALLLRQEFPMRGLARAVFFLPVLVATGPVIAVIKGDIICENIDLWGKVEGELFVKDTLALKEGCKMNGNINISRLSVELGATFNGTCRTITEAEFNKLTGAAAPAAAEK